MSGSGYFYLNGGEIMIYQESYVYHIKDEYLKKVQSEPLKFP